MFSYMKLKDWEKINVTLLNRLRITVYDVRDALSKAEVVMGRVEFPVSRINQVNIISLRYKNLDSYIS